MIFFEIFLKLLGLATLSKILSFFEVDEIGADMFFVCLDTVRAIAEKKGNRLLMHVEI